MNGADAVSVLDACLHRIVARNPFINAFLTVDADGARLAAQAASERWRQGRPLSPIDGMPIGIKANIAVAGMPWHAGIGAYRDRIATHDAAGVARLRQAGAVLLGTLNMDAAALGASTDNAVFGRTENPWRPGYSAGGSSGGAGAAVAAGFCVAALGTDTLGSVRIPASYCGVVGVKPCHSAIPLDGVVELAPAFDTLGVLAADLEVASHVLAVMGAGGAVVEPVGTLGVLVAPDADVAAEVLAALERAAGAAALLGWRVVQVKLPGIELRALRQAALLITVLAADRVYGAAVAEQPEGFCGRFRDMLKWGRGREAEFGPAARGLVLEASAVLRDCFAGCEAVLMPTTPSPAFAFAEGARRDQADFTVLANVSGLAAVAFPVGADVLGLPLSLQVVSSSLSSCFAAAGVCLALN
jgi:aspartyl-tRNA(Asn)/glutamyl-tRNA(Gln) amidotransferase subunit A